LIISVGSSLIRELGSLCNESNEMNVASNKSSLILCLLLLIGVLACNHASCESSTRVSIVKDNNPPTFTLSGNGTLIRFIVVGPYLSLEDMESYKRGVPIVWELSSGDYDKTLVDDLPSITYGTTPSGFEQITPKDGFPPVLEEGKFYRIGTPSTGANFITFCFKIEESRTVKIPCR
jgi:hypothetical protein